MKVLFLPMFLFLFSTATMAQGTSDASPAATALEKQFNNLKSNSNSYKENRQEYKVVNVNALNAFWKNVQASMEQQQQKLLNASKDTRAELEKAQATIAQQQRQLQALKKENAQKEQEVQKSISAVTNLSVLGLEMPKQVYVLLTAIIIIALLVVLAAVMAMYRRNKGVTEERRKAYDEMELELTEYKKSAREKELKLKRELQTEMNRIEELNKEIASLQRHHH